VRTVHRKNSGFTIIEALMIIVIVSLAVPALLLVLGQGARQSALAEIAVTGTNVAQAMMEEIKSKKWDENYPIPPGSYTAALGPEAGEGRQNCTGNAVGIAFDDIDDYNGYSETCTWGGKSFTTSVAVCYVDPADLTTCIGLSDYKRITVTVTHATLGAVELVTVAANY
jgi:type II secretory pathway pseudopilin PulG